MATPSIATPATPLYLLAMEFNEAFPGNFTDSAQIDAVKCWLREKESALPLRPGTLMSVNSTRHLVDWTCGGSKPSPGPGPRSTWSGLLTGHFMGLTATEYNDRLTLATTCSTDIQLSWRPEAEAVYLMSVIMGTEIEILQEV